MNDTPNYETIVEIWKKVVQTQEHFNELCMKIRTIHATVLAATISLCGVLMKDVRSISVTDSIAVHASIPILISICCSSLLFYFADRHWYHRLLVGAVKQGTMIEEKWKNELPELGLGQAIGKESPVDLKDDKIKLFFLKIFVSDKRLRLEKKLHSEGKVEAYYMPFVKGSLVLALITAPFGGISVNGDSLLTKATSSLCSLIPFPTFPRHAS